MVSSAGEDFAVEYRGSPQEKRIWIRGHRKRRGEQQRGDSPPVLTLSRADGYLTFDLEECAKVGEAYHAQYVGNTLFPHFSFGNFLERTLLERVVAEFPAREKGRFSDSYSQLKTGYALGQIRSAFIQELLSALNSAYFLTFLEKLTGIEGLVNDPYYSGGGLHEIARGGHLSIHADFNVQARTHLRRRLNLILYLSEDWKPEYGGNLELWDGGMQVCQKSVPPVLGQAVIFNTDTTSYHSHPEPLNCPEECYRRSNALYYSVPATNTTVRHSTLFQPCPGSADAPLPLKERLLNRVYRLLSR